MLTRIRVNGFKNLQDVDVEFGPYTCIAGPNAVGKSNLFDAIEFLSLLAEHPFMEAAQRLRASGQRFGDPKSLFAIGVDGVVAADIDIEAELIVGDTVVDDFGQTAAPRSTFLRYNVVLRYLPPVGSASTRVGTMSLVRESLEPIIKGDAHAHIRWRHSARDFRDALVKNNRFGKAYISTVSDELGTTLQIHADGGSRGNPRKSPISNAIRTALSGASSADEPTMLAVRQEMLQWRKLALEPSALRSPDTLYGGQQLVGPDGAHVAATLWRLAQNNSDVYSLVAANVSELTDVRDVRVVADEARDLLTLEARLGNGPFLPARSLSDGTLRFLALTVLEADPDYLGLITMEEPENGIHPAKVPAMIGLLRRLAVDPFNSPGPDNPLRQVIVNTHSPTFVQGQSPEELVLAMPTAFREIGRHGVTFAGMRGTWRARQGTAVVTPLAISSYLQDPNESPVWQKLELPLDFNG